MEWVQIAMVVVVVWLLSWGYLVRGMKRNRGLKLPPGPRAWPIVGCVPFLPRLNPPELMFAKLAAKYGELMLLWMGSRTCVVVSSARMAMEILKTHDQEFANRPDSIAFEYISFQNTALVPMSSNNPLFKPTRRMFTTEIVSPRKVAATADLRKEQVLKMLRVIVQESDAGRCVNFTKEVSILAMNLAIAMNFGREYSAKVVDEAEVLVRTFRRLLPCIIRSNLGDVFPALRWLDVQGIEAELTEVSVQMRKSIMALIEKKKLEMSMWSAEEKTIERNDIMSKLLSMEGEDRFSEEQLVSVVFSVLIAGTDTIYKAITEAMHEVVRNPHIHKQALDELNAAIGTTTTTRIVEESDIPSLPFLQNIVKETLRLHPPAPTMLPHRNFEPCSVAGYHIPANTSVLINVHAIMRDPEFWDSPAVFSPDRWADVSKRKPEQGSDFHFIPFGFGRRQCPAINLGMTTVTYVVAVCLQCIGWEIPAGMVRRESNVATEQEPRKKEDLFLAGTLRVDPLLLEFNA